jgi:hypothetical protein
MVNRNLWARVAALTASLAIITAALPAGSTFAQQAPTQDLAQARSGEDGTSGAGAGSGNTSTGNAGRDKDGNGGNASAGSAGEVGSTESADSDEAALPENAEVLSALGVLDDVTLYDLDILNGLDIPIALLPPPPAEPVSAVSDDIDTGGVGASGETAPGATSTGETTSTGESSSISTEPGTGAAPAGGSTGTAAADGVGSTESGERDRDRPRNDDGVTEAPGG